MEAADVGHDIERLVDFLAAGPRTDPGALLQAEYTLAHLERGAGEDAYRLEKIAAVRADFRHWLGGDLQPADARTAQFRAALVHDIERLRKAFARGSEPQD